MNGVINLRARPAPSAQWMNSGFICVRKFSPQVVVDCEVEHLAIVLLGIYGLPPSAPSGYSEIGRRLPVLGVYGLTVSPKRGF